MNESQTQLQTLEEFLVDLEQQEAAKKDIVLSSARMVMREGEELHIPGHGFKSGVPPLKINDVAHGQICTHLQFGRPFYGHLRSEHRDLLSVIVTELLRRGGSRRLLRTQSGVTRAFLSDRYRIMDHCQILQHALPVLFDVPEIKILSHVCTDRRLYLKCVFPRMQQDVSVGDTVQSGLILSNSDVGLGGTTVRRFVYRLVCSNGQIVERAQSRHHVGRQLEARGDIVYRDETRQADDRAFLLALEDTIKSVARDENGFTRHVDKLRQAAGDVITRDPIDTVEVLAKRVNLSKTEHNSVLEAYLGGRDRTRWGLLNAVTETAHGVTDYDRQVQLETLGGQMTTTDPRSKGFVALN